MTLTPQRVEQLRREFDSRFNAIGDLQDYAEERQRLRLEVGENIRVAFQQLLVETIKDRTEHKHLTMGRKVNRKPWDITRFSQGQYSPDIFEGLIRHYKPALEQPPPLVAPTNADYDWIVDCTLANDIHREHGWQADEIDREKYECVTRFLQIPQIFRLWLRANFNEPHFKELHEAKDNVFSQVLSLAMDHFRRLPVTVPGLNQSLLIGNLRIATLSSLLEVVASLGPVLKRLTLGSNP